MIVSKNFKDLAQKAYDAGFRRVFSCIGQCYDTVYINYINLASVIAAEPGADFTYRHTGRWSGLDNMRSVTATDISYRDVFEKFSK